MARVAGNISNEDILGSLKYGCKVPRAKLIVVLGHEHCGAIKSAVEGVELGNITALLAKIKPAIESLKDFEEDGSQGRAKNRGGGAEYYMETGQVEFLQL